MNKTLIAMSGGVDSSVAAYMLKKQGHDCAGAMMKLYDSDDPSLQSGCCSLEDVEDARAVAFRLDMPFYVFNFTDTFAQQVIDRFAAAYQEGLTPNPCIDCNRYMQFERFLSRASELEQDFIATGHYARVTRSGDRYFLRKGLDPSKDQSYVLYMMSQDHLARTLFPVGELAKSEVREIAQEQGFVNAKKRDSQDICFAPDGDYAGFIERHTGKSPEKGRFVDIQGNTLGQHRGIIHYTVGQRKGLGISAGQPLYVCDVCPQNNTVVVGRQEDLYAKTLFARDINLIAVDRLDAPLKIRAKIRYRQQEQPATVRQTDDGNLQVEFDQPQRAITKGQAVVLYDGDVVVGGGTISGYKLTE